MTRICRRISAVLLVVLALIGFLACFQGPRQPYITQAAGPGHLLVQHSEPDRQSAQITLPLSAQLVVPAGEPIIAGLLAPNLKVTIRNTTPLAARQGVGMPLQVIVLRGVQWANYRDDDRQWLRPLPGNTDEGSDGMVTHNLTAGGRTHLAFETGLILPGEEVTVPMPITPQRHGKHELVIRYAVIGGSKDWMSEILLPAELPRYAGAWFRLATPALVARRKGTSDLSAHDYPPAYEALGLVRATSKPDALPLTTQTRVLPLQLPLATDPRAEQTGRLSIEEAARRAGLDPLTDTYLTFYREPLRSWFFVREDRSAVALRLEVDPHANASPKAPPLFRWAPKPLPRMDWAAPDEFNTAEGGSTTMLLRATTFADVVNVTAATLKGYGEVVEAKVSPQELWRVLERALERDVELRVITVYPNGLRPQRLLAAGVTVNETGR